MRTVSETSRTALKCINIQIIAGPEEKQKGSKKMFEEIIVKNFPNTGKEIVKVQEVQRVPQECSVQFLDL